MHLMCSPLESKEKAHADNCGFMACSPTCGHSRHCYCSQITGNQEVTSTRLVPRNASALSEARFHESVKLGVVLCARSIEPFEGGRWRLRRMRANGWTRSNGYVN